MNITVVGTGYVGLVTGVCLSEMGHNVVCADSDVNKISLLERGQSPIYELGLADLIVANADAGRLSFTTDTHMGVSGADVMFIAVGTPPLPDGRADLSNVYKVAETIAQAARSNSIVVMKSTVPVGTCHNVADILKSSRSSNDIAVVDNPEFLREGCAIDDTMHPDRIVIGSESQAAGDVIEDMYAPLNAPVVRTDLRSAEFIKYASNAFLATKISFINEISNLAEKLGADVTDIAYGMGLDARIGRAFLNAGIGYGGSCFPKDTSALIQIAGNVEHDFELLKSVVKVNARQQVILVDKLAQRFGRLDGLKVALLGLTFKPNTDDMRFAASISVANRLIASGVEVSAYDPMLPYGVGRHLHPQVALRDSIDGAIDGVDAIFILTEWEQIRAYDWGKVVAQYRPPVVFDGRNCLDLAEVRRLGMEYHSIGRRTNVSQVESLERM